MPRHALLLLLALVSLAPPVAAQEAVRTDSALAERVPEPGASPDQLRGQLWSMAGVLGAFGGIGVFSYMAWWRDLDRGSFRVSEETWFGTQGYAGGADKVGHVYANYIFTRSFMATLRAGGWSPSVAGLVSGSLTSGVFLAAELQDGYHTSFEWGDQVTNLLGVGLALALETWPGLDRALDLRMAYWPSPPYRQAFARDGDVDFVEDYTGQSYHLVLHLNALPVVDRAPGLLRFVDLQISFRALDYEPHPPSPRPAPRQILGFGLALDLQRLLDELLFDRFHGRSLQRARAVAGWFNEYFMCKWSYLDVPVWQRQARLQGEELAP